MQNRQQKPLAKTARGFVKVHASESFHQTSGEQQQIADEREPEAENADNGYQNDRAEDRERKQDYGNNHGRVVRRIGSEMESRTPTATSTPCCLGHESPLVLA